MQKNALSQDLTVLLMQACAAVNPQEQFVALSSNKQLYRLTQFITMLCLQTFTYQIYIQYQVYLDHMKVSIPPLSPHTIHSYIWYDILPRYGHIKTASIITISSCWSYIICGHAQVQSSGPLRSIFSRRGPWFTTCQGHLGWTGPLVHNNIVCGNQGDNNSDGYLCIL